MIRALKVVVFLLCLVPLLLLVWGALTPFGLGANPEEKLTHTTGDWILRFLVLTLCITPLRRITGWNQAIRFRRMLGLFAFFYACLHLSIYALFRASSFTEIQNDIAMRPYVTVGFAGFVLMIPLAVTSTKKWIGRLGGRRWQMLHRLIYVSAIAGVLHYLWLVKADIRFPVRYGIVVGLLLLFRVWTALRSRQAVTQVSGG